MKEADGGLGLGGVIGATEAELKQRREPTRHFDLWSTTHRQPHRHRPPKTATEDFPLGECRGWCVQRVLRAYLLLGQCYALFPVYGVLADDPAQLRFSWRSYRAVCNLVVLASYVFMASLQIVYSVNRGSLNFKTIDNITGYWLYVVTLTLLLVQARSWPDLMRRWRAVELRMARFPASPVRHTRLAVNAYVITFTVGTLLLGLARVASNASSLYGRCTRDPLTLLHMTIISKFGSAVRVVGYSPPTLAGLALLALFLHQNTVMVFDELTIVVLPLCLAHRFRQLHTHMRAYDKQNMGLGYWAEMRDTYNRLCRLARRLDRHITSLTFVTVGSNLYFICSLLLSSLRHWNKGGWANVSILYLLAFTIWRTLAAALAGAALHEHSRRPFLALLFNVPSESYNTEVVRFQMQAAHDEITISGCDFFALTRSFILTVAGTIITYEIVLLQFGSDDETVETSSVKSSTCASLERLLGITSH